MNVTSFGPLTLDSLFFNRLQETEMKLKAITDVQEVNIDSFALVKENQVIIDEMKVRSSFSCTVVSISFTKLILSIA
jgi:hypothetical protein